MNRQYYLVLGLIIFTILSILAFDLYILKFGKFWEKKTPPQKVALSTPSSELQPWKSNPLVKKAKEIGYNIIWMDPKDTVGRTVFYEERQKSDFNFRGMGTITTLTPGQEKLPSYIEGIVEDFKEIENSNDLYINLTNPLTKEVLPKIRLIFTKGSSQQTALMLENLSYGLSNPYSSNENQSGFLLGNLSQFGKENFKKIIKSGDAVVIGVLSKTTSNTFENQRDKNNQLIGNYLVLRRFGEKAQLEVELK